MLFLCADCVKGVEPLCLSHVLLPYEHDYCNVTDSNQFMYVKYDLSSVSAMPLSYGTNV